MKRIFLAIVIVLIGLTAFAADPPGTKVPIGLIVGSGKTKTVIDSTELKMIKDIDDKIDNSTLGSSLDEFYNKTQSNARFINEDGDTITGIIYIPTAAAGTVTQQAVNAEYLKIGGYGRLIYSNNVQHLHTGTTNETELFNFTIPANSLGANGSLQFIFKIQSTSGTTGTKYIRLKNGSSVLGFSFINSASNQINKSICTTENRNSTSSQISSNASLTTFNSAFTLTTIDTAQPWTISVTGQLGVGTENVSIESLSVIAYYKD